MVRQINETFDDSDYDLLVKKKGKFTWREFILTLLEK